MPRSGLDWVDGAPGVLPGPTGTRLLPSGAPSPEAALAASAARGR